MPSWSSNSSGCPIYNKIIDDLMVAAALLMKRGKAMKSLMRCESKPRKPSGPFIYRKLTYTPDQLKKFSDEGRTPTIRFAMPVKEHRFH